MKNTHTEYLSSERTPTVYPELEELLPALSAEEFSALEADILVNGCYAISPSTRNGHHGHYKLSKWAMAQIAMKLKPNLEEKARANQGTRTDLFLDSEKRVTPVKEIARTFNAIGDLIKNEFLPKHWKDRQEVIDVESRDAS